MDNHECLIKALVIFYKFLRISPELIVKIIMLVLWLRVSFTGTSLHSLGAALFCLIYTFRKIRYGTNLNLLYLQICEQSLSVGLYRVAHKK